MAKFIIGTLVFSLIFIQTVFPQKKSDLDKTGFRGKIKSIQYFSSSFNEDSGWFARKLYITETFNLDGNITERIVFQNGQPDSKVINNYDEQGRNIGNISFSAGMDKTMTIPTKTELILDNKSNILQLNVYYQGSQIAEVKHTYKYDERGNQIERNYGAPGKSTMTFDDNNNEISTTNSDGKGVIYGKSSTKFNGKNHKIKVTIYDHETLRWEISYTYDIKDRLSEIETREFNTIANLRTSHAPEPGKIVYSYDDRNKTSQTVKYLLNGDLVPKSTTIFNEQGKEIGLSCEKNDLESCQTVFKFESDNYGNLIKKICYGRDDTTELLKVRWMEEREISYY